MENLSTFFAQLSLTYLNNLLVQKNILLFYDPVLMIMAEKPVTEIAAILDLIKKIGQPVRLTGIIFYHGFNT